MDCRKRRALRETNSKREASYNIGRMKKVREIDAVVFIFVGYDDPYGDIWDRMLWSSEEGGCV